VGHSFNLTYLNCLEVRESDESFGSSLYKATFSVSNTNDGLISARLFVVLENAVLNNKEGTTLRVYRKTMYVLRVHTRISFPAFNFCLALSWLKSATRICQTMDSWRWSL
jgi:hypothetical protein